MNEREMSKVAQDREAGIRTKARKIYVNNPREDNTKQERRGWNKELDEHIYNLLYIARGPWYEYVLALQSPFPSTSSLIVRAS